MLRRLEFAPSRERAEDVFYVLSRKASSMSVTKKSAAVDDDDPWSLTSIEGPALPTTPSIYHLNFLLYRGACFLAARKGIASKNELRSRRVTLSSPRLHAMSFLHTAPPAEEARPTATETKKRVDKKGAQIRTGHTPNDTLEARCRSVIVANLERYPPQALGILSQDSWDSIVRERNEKTKPSTGTGGLDGTGRLLPAISDRFLAEVETIPHFTDSAVADRLAWKDCVEYRFRSGGLTRPAALQNPWPLLVSKLKRSGDTLIELLNADNKPSDKKQDLLERHVKALSESPMNVSLLQASGAGKSVKKFIKACTKEKPSSLDVHTECATLGSQSVLAQLEQTLQRWKHMAKNSGVQINTNDGQGTNEDNSHDDQEDMRLAESCQSWSSSRSFSSARRSDELVKEKGCARFERI